MSLTPLFMFTIARRTHEAKAFDITEAGRSRAAAVQFLLSQLVPAQDGSGLLFYSRMKGRVLESALVLHILQKYDLDYDWQNELRAFLIDHGPSADLFSATVAGAVVPSEDEVLQSVHSFGVNRLLGSLQYAKGRKHALLATILGEVGALPFHSVAINPSRFAAEATHLFSRLYMAALKIIYTKGTNSHVNVDDEIDFLAQAQGANGGWEQQALITIAALIAIGSEHPSFERGLSFLKTLRRDDGGIAFCDNLNLWTTSLAALALLKTEEVPVAVFHRIADYVVSRQHDNGGWAFSEGVAQTDTDTSAQCAQMLIQLDPERYVAPIARAHHYFLRLQRDDGGYPTYEIEGDSEVTMTANIVLVQALSAKRIPELGDPLRSALPFLRARQKPDGTFERSWSLCETYSIFRVNLALNGCRGFDGEVDFGEIQRRSLEYLLNTQHPDGGWGQTAVKPSDALSSSYALLSLALLRRQVPPERIDKALKYLLSQQDKMTGEFVSIPDVVGPRPIVFNVPLLSTIFPVMALRIVEQI